MTATYATVEEASDYLEARGLNTAWDAADEYAQAAALVEATSFLDASFSWVGKVYDTDQILGWPRVCAYDREGRVVSGIPTSVIQACAELANLALGGRLAPMELASTLAAVKRDKMGDVEVEYDNTASVETYDYVRMLLRGLGGYRSMKTGMNTLIRA